MGKRVLNYQEVLSLLKQGKHILYLGGASPSAAIELENRYATVRLDTLHKLWKQGLVTHYGYPDLHSMVYLKDKKGTSDS